MTLLLSPLSAQAGKVLEVPTLNSAAEYFQAVDSTTIPVSVNTSQVVNVSSVPGGTATTALDNLQASIAAATAALLAVIAGLTTDNIANASSVAGVSDSDALETLAEAIANTGSGTGYIQRLGYVPAGSTRIGSSFAGAVLQGPATWNTPAQVPPGNVFTWDIWAGGSGGCGGKAASTGSATTGTGKAASGAAHKRIVLFRADILADLPFSIAPGARGLGSVGASRTGNLGGGTTYPAAPGATGALTSIGTLARVFPGAGGSLELTGAQTAGNSGGGSMSAGIQNAGGTVAVAGGLPGASAAGAQGEGGAGAPTGTNGLGGLSAEHGGASSGSNASGGTTPSAGGTSLYGSCAGGQGGQWNSGAAAVNGANGGGILNPGIGGALAATSGATNAIAGNGTNGGDGSICRGASGGGGGGGARCFSPVSPYSARGGDGGDGGFPGGGGGGGGDASSGTFVGLVTDTIRGGDGGDGSDGLALVTIT